MFLEVVIMVVIWWIVTFCAVTLGLEMFKYVGWAEGSRGISWDSESSNACMQY